MYTTTLQISTKAQRQAIDIGIYMYVNRKITRERERRSKERERRRPMTGRGRRQEVYMRAHGKQPAIFLLKKCVLGMRLLFS